MDEVSARFCQDPFVPVRAVAVVSTQLRGGNVGERLAEMSKVRMLEVDMRKICVWSVVWNMNCIFPNSWDDDPI